MLKMRLQRIGRKNDPSFRVVVTNSQNGPRAGNHVDIIGSYNPKMNTIQIDGEKAKEWIAKGVQVSDTVHNLLVSEKVIEGKKVNVLPKKAPIVSDEPEAEAAPATDEATPEAAEEAPAVEEVKEETPAEEKAEESAPEAPAEEPTPETPEEEPKEETPAPEATEEKVEDTPAEEDKVNA